MLVISLGWLPVVRSSGRITSGRRSKAARACVTIAGCWPLAIRTGVLTSPSTRNQG